MIIIFLNIICYYKVNYNHTLHMNITSKYSSILAIINVIKLHNIYECHIIYTNSFQYQIQNFNFSHLLPLLTPPRLLNNQHASLSSSLLDPCKSCKNVTLIFAFNFDLKQ